MDTQPAPRNGSPRGRYYYDAGCVLCTGFARRLAGPLSRIGFDALPLQAPGAGADLGVTGATLLDEARLRTPEGAVFGGADALAEISRRIWWAWPLWAISRLPGILPLLRRAYCHVAARRSCAGAACRVQARRTR